MPLRVAGTTAQLNPRDCGIQSEIIRNSLPYISLKGSAFTYIREWDPRFRAIRQDRFTSKLGYLSAKLAKFIRIGIGLIWLAIYLVNKLIIVD